MNTPCCPVLVNPKLVAKVGGLLPLRNPASTITHYIFIIYIYLLFIFIFVLYIYIYVSMHQHQNQPRTLACELPKAS